MTDPIQAARARADAAREFHERLLARIDRVEHRRQAPPDAVHGWREAVRLSLSRVDEAQARLVANEWIEGTPGLKQLVDDGAGADETATRAVRLSFGEHGGGDVDMEHIHTAIARAEQVAVGRPGDWGELDSQVERAKVKYIADEFCQQTGLGT
jgi:hypothetical protein